MTLSPKQFLALSLDPARMFRARGCQPDPWQRDFLRSRHPRILLNCCRQAGKSTVTAAVALHQALFHPDSLVLLVSRSQRQSGELFRKVLDFYNALGRPVKATSASALQMQLANGSRVVTLPGKEANIRAYSAVALLIIDEAARVPEELYRAVRPMLAVSGGRLILLSTPFGRRGFFWDEWIGNTTAWRKVRITAGECPRIAPDFLAEEQRTLGLSWYRQEYECSFEALEGLVYPDFARCVADEAPPTVLVGARLVGGIDWGWRNPFAAVWGVLDGGDVLRITHERYERHTPLHQHFQALPKGCTWYADPAGRTEIEEARAGGFKVLAGDNSLRAGIAAVTARIQTGRLRVGRGCANLIAEAGLYRYPRRDEYSGGREDPLDAHNHALAALRYSVSRIDHKFMVRFRGAGGPAVGPTGISSAGPTAGPPVPRKDWLHPSNDTLWTPL